MDKAYLRGGILLLSLGLIGFSSFQIKSVADQRVALTREVNKSDTELKALKAKYADKYTKVNHEATLKAKKSSNPALRTVANQNINYEKVNSVATKFFNIYYTFSDTKEYLARANKLKDIITPSIKNDKEIFDNGKDSTGGDYIKSTGLQSEFDTAEAYLSQSSNTKAQALVKVTNTAWTSSRSNSGSIIHYYDLTYDTTTQKISSLKLVFTEGSDSDGK